MMIDAADDRRRSDSLPVSTPGPIVLLGSGETSPSVRAVYDRLFQRLTPPLHVAILETPAGFEPNSAAVAGQIGAFLTQRLQNHRPLISLVPARKKDTPFSPDDPALLAPLFDADVIMMGPGSPTYAVRQLHQSLAWQTLQACHRLGAMVIFSSAATIASGAQALPVYEIYKVGEDLHWQDGLDFFADFGLQLILIPHWDNRDGGAELDTSRCYLGQARFEQLCSLLSLPAAADSALVGIDERTALVIEPLRGSCWVSGPGGVTVVRGGVTQRFEAGHFPAAELGPFRLPRPAEGLPVAIWEEAQERTRLARAQRAVQTPPSAVARLLEERDAARLRRDWAAADLLRGQIEAAGWQVLDTESGSLLAPNSEG